MGRRRRIAIWAMVLAMCAATSAAQRTPPVYVDPSARAMRAFHDALRRSESGVVRVSVYGASHTASDELTRVLRRRLQHRFGSAGPGFVLPVAPFPFYEQDGMELTGSGWRGLKVRGREQRLDQYGLAGFAIEASGEARATVQIDSDRAPLKQLRVYFQRRQGGGTLVVRAGQAQEVIATRSRESPVVITLEHEARRIRVEARGDGPVRLYGLELTQGESGVVVDSFGVPGAKLSDQRKWRDESLGAQLQTRPPHLVALAYGTNESASARVSIAEYRRRLVAAIQRWRRLAPQASLLLIGPGDWPRLRRNGSYTPRRRLLQVIATQREVARQMNVAFFDTYLHMGGEGSMVRWMEQGLAQGDAVHFSSAGYDEISTAITRALLRGFERENSDE